MTSLQEIIMNDLKDAMRQKNTLAKGVLTLLKAGLQRAEKEKKAALTADEEIAVVQRELKQTRQTLTEGKKAGRVDIVETENKKIAVIEQYLPTMMTEEEIVAFLVEKGIQKGTNLGKAMGLLMKEKKSQCDSSFAKTVIEKHFG